MDIIKKDTIEDETNSILRMIDKGRKDVLKSDKNMSQDDNISDKIYQISRSLFVYVKKAHIDSIPGIEDFLNEFLSEKAMGDFGYLAEKGLIPLPAPELLIVQDNADNLISLKN